ncbi:hypothetical protein SAMN05421770_102390 [Granulicella rosea]|uniref:Uncharacterized protein n=1 Tax=Granulicella rosea TaxID=474952 RepID=A0A239HGR7_9BACT|nr:hypothetical protein [Granulicella rosea]SNS80238.1 hypothetical protein SAMN05421770_102390 [Granulicella rosea]
MNTKGDFEDRERRRSPRFRAITAIFIILFTVMCYLLAQSMMRHHFLDGGRDNNRSQH